MAGHPVKQRMGVSNLLEDLQGEENNGNLVGSRTKESLKNTLEEALRALPFAALQTRLLAGSFRGSGPARSGRIDFAPVRRSRSGRRGGVCRLQPRLAVGSSAAAFTRPGPPPLPACASHSAITGGGKWLRRKRSRQGIRPVTPFAYASPFFGILSRFPQRSPDQRAAGKNR